MIEHPKIYLLPNLMTAGNLCCGFAAIVKILEGALEQAASPEIAAAKFHLAIVLILGACAFDLLDGRLARLGGHESAFGREFDSLADIVSFGVAPALMVYRVVLHQFPNLGWVVASLYLLCGGLRLARFNCLAAADSEKANREFTGFPIPAAAGLTASLTLFMLWLGETNRELGASRWVLPVLLVFLSGMMFSAFRYPSFKSINWRTTRSVPRFLVIVLVLALSVMYYQIVPALLFTAYLLYGFFRPFLSRRMQRNIEEDEDEEEQVSDPGHGP